jgi:predicted dehydrogenase
MKLCMAGLRGHWQNVMSEVRAVAELEFAGMAPGFDGEDLAEFVRYCSGTGMKAPKIYPDYRTMLDAAKPDIMAIFGPFETHAAMSVEALDRGIHVICEKPVATTLEDLQRLEDACRRAGRHFVALTWMRYEPTVYTCWEAVRAGRIGKVRLVHAQKSYNLGQRPEYFFRRENSSGIMLWVGSHAIDLIHWMSGEKFTRVFGGHSRLFNRDHGDLEMSAVAEFHMTGEVLGSVSIDYLNPPTASEHGVDRVRVAGTEGVVEVFNGRVVLTNAEQNGEQVLPAQCDRSGLRDFVDHILRKAPARLDARQSLDVARACLLARQSADEGRVVTF